MRASVNLADRADVRLIERLVDAGVTSVTEGDAAVAADRHANLRGIVRLQDGIAEVEDAPAFPITGTLQLWLRQGETLWPE